MVNIKFLITALLSTLMVAMSAGSHAAETGKPIAKVTEVMGRVLVNQGDEYVTARPGLELYVDDRIVTMDNSEVTIFYPDLGGGGKVTDRGCEVRLPENSQMVVESEEDCIMGAIISSNVDEAVVVGEPPVVAAVTPNNNWVPLIFVPPVICAITDCLGDDDDDDNGPIPPPVISPE